MILLLGSIKDPHIHRVSKYLDHIQSPHLILDWLVKTPHQFAMESTGEFSLKIDGTKVTKDTLIWDRLKIIPGSVLYPEGDKRSAQYATKEWHAFLYLISGLFGENVVNSLNSRNCMIKPMQQAVAAQQGFQTPNTMISNDKAAIQEFIQRENDCIIKSISAGKIIPKGGEAEHPYNAMTMAVTAKDVESESEESLAYCPSFFQQNVKKKYELRVVTVNREIHAFKVDSQGQEYTKTDWRTGNSILEFEPVTLDETLKQKIHGFMKAMGLFSGSLDLIVAPDGEVWFLECNQDGQWGWLDDIVDGAIARTFAEELHKKALQIADAPTNTKQAKEMISA